MHTAHWATQKAVAAQINCVGTERVQTLTSHSCHSNPTCYLPVPGCLAGPVVFGITSGNMNLQVKSLLAPVHTLDNG
jgi:hypothetical protein